MNMMKPFAICLASALLASPVFVIAQKPVREGATSTLYKQPPSTLVGLYAASDAVLVVRVSGQEGKDSLQGGQRVLTEITAAIVEVVKPSPQVGPAGTSIQFRVSGGEVDRGDHIERVIDHGQPKLVAGHDYLVALTWDRTEGAFFPAFGPGAIFEVTGGTVTPQRKTTLAAAVNGLNSRQMIAELKKAQTAVK
jgi:hypothetical protein